MLYNSLLKRRFKNIKNPYFDVMYEIILSCNKDYHLCRCIISGLQYDK